MNTKKPYPYQQAYQQICELLLSYADKNEKSQALAHTIAHKSLLMNHLYEDMGLSSRQEMNTLMQEHFPRLAAQKPDNIRWKKYLYDTIGHVAPACDLCHDYDNCFDCRILQ
ncbi:nitrogen fixation protein NifQ [Desulfurispira natronophila]|uniref:Nitrogen fixation protein NifQ n=1 Tax=Desulfurispira natronophila TaxID=682562 RepID=A0A7W7Y3J2_9BACT|nr:nitrogen fixation protein NifQ [Desulfurispira natronophila]MBB5021441.1 nitrogen fixation protein NifQ [Desulfurispira natronophila]